MEHDRFLDLLFARSRRANVTMVLIALNALVFVASAGMSGNLMQISSPVLLTLGANHAPLVMQGEVWRLLAAMFLHGGLLHIGFNMFALYQAGQIVERLFGARAFLLLYLAAGLAGNVASMWWNPQAVSVGASGAVFGVYGALLAYVRAQPGSMPISVFNQIRSSTLAFIGYSLFAGFALPGIDNGAHVGGLVAGLALGYGLAQPLDSARSLHLGSPRALIALLLVAVASAWMWHRVPLGQPGARLVRAPSDGGFGRAVEQMTGEEGKLVARTDGLLDNLRRRKIDAAQAADELRREVVPRWQVQVDEMSQLHLPDGLMEQRRQQLVRYAELRRDAMIALADAIQRNDKSRMEAANAFQQEADRLIDEMRAD
jgi:rhomboid protease GluP